MNRGKDNRRGDDGGEIGDTPGTRSPNLHLQRLTPTPAPHAFHHSSLGMGSNQREMMRVVMVVVRIREGKGRSDTKHPHHHSIREGDEGQVSQAIHPNPFT